MGFDPNPRGSTGWEEKLHDAGTRVEDELRWLVTYINDQVVPEVRKNGSVALRAAAEQMQKLAQKMDDHARAANEKAGPKQ